MAWTDIDGTSVPNDSTNYVIHTGIFDTDDIEQTITLTVKAVANTGDTTYTCEIINSTDSSSIGGAVVNLNVFSKCFRTNPTTAGQL